ncbi:MAG: nucleotidyltransferase family protein [Gaiellaceae bacterium]
MLGLLTMQRLVALLGSRALEAAPAALPPEFAAAVDRARAAARARGLALEGLATHVAERLDGAGIRTLVLKGPPLARRLHGDEGLRDTNDLDLLVDPARIDEAVAIACRLGYRAEPVDPGARADGRPDLHYTLRDPAGRLTRIELHWRIDWYEDEFSRELLDRSAPASAGLREPRPEDDLAALLLFYARDGLFGLRAPADLAAWWDRYGEDAGTFVLARHWERHPALRRALVAAVLAAEHVARLPAERLLPPSARPTRRTRIAVALASPSGAGDPDQLAANAALVDHLLTPAGGQGAALRRHVLLPPQRIESAYRLPPDASVRRAAWRLLHPPKIALRYVLGLAGAMGRDASKRPAPAPKTTR